MDTANMTLPNLQTDVQKTTTAVINKPLKPIDANTEKSITSKLKCVRKKRSVGKTDRHSKIHTAQGLRDRRMRLSVNTARKFFDLNDMLGFDKASKTIEWLFSKSQKAIQEVTETFQSDGVAQTVSTEYQETGLPISVGETESTMEVAAVAENDLEKSKQLFQAHPSVEYHLSQLGLLENHDNDSMKEYPLEFSNTYHFLKHLHLDNTVRNSDNYLRDFSAVSTTNYSILDYNKTIAEPPAGWLNSRNTFLGFLEGCSENQGQ